MSSETGRLFAIGDIHGWIGPLRYLVENRNLQPQDTLVILGDTINRGPASKEVLDFLIELSHSIHLVPILGNHEEEMLLARHDRQALDRWMEMGGCATLASYGSDATLDDVPESHWSFLDSYVPYWQTEHFIFAHANCDPSVPLEWQSSDFLRWLSIHDMPPKPHFSGKTVIVGHTPNLNGQVVDLGYLRCLDTGCGLGGCLTIMDVNTGEQWQRDECVAPSADPGTGS